MLTEDEKLDLGLIQPSLQNPQFEAQIFCSKGSQALQYCITETCKSQNAFICGAKKCQCRQNHKSCIKADLEFTIKKIQSKIVNPAKAKESIETKFDHLIDQISEFKDQVATKLNGLNFNLDYSKLYPVEKDFLESIKKGTAIKLTPTESAKLWNGLNGKYAPKNDIYTEITNELNIFHEAIQNQQKATQKKIHNIIEKQELINSSKDAKLSLQNYFKFESSILTDALDIQNLIAMFTKPIDDAKILFKASQHDFKMSKYYELCGEQNNTMVICKTTTDKILGGYTPVKFVSEEKLSGFVGDQSKSSILFSLTENDKFELERKDRAIYRDSKKSELTFGNVDLELCDEANKFNKSSTFMRNRAYSNPKYKDDEESFMRLTGSKDLHFMTKEWEVWKISFEGQIVDDKKEQKVEEQEMSGSQPQKNTQDQI